MDDDNRNCNNCGCGCGGRNNGILGGLFNSCGCGDNSEILFFIIVFLLLFTNFGCGCSRWHKSDSFPLGTFPFGKSVPFGNVPIRKRPQWESVPLVSFFYYCDTFGTHDTLGNVPNVSKILQLYEEYFTLLTIKNCNVII